ncbi:TetR/AcrR family transcriptional regulator [Thalassotalea sp. LPB0316]|uniref:TetR/AcrR family transcriptional regulator n=1 Tax=Thalassotalea sp. LPB0316 TaxID=2769490 RepID=UPI00186759C5|nr:TetR/AcrR family transcriptional regulator [Thalassotalea sp. LPB0316]QOL26358.1 TetR/AcrR family transcriptional regulator [Thalassotalea sp. LPB0316]
MSEYSVIEPKQLRSQKTQRKLLDALHHCLEEKFFEHISIKELAEHAGVSVGTFYRRFKDKESLLPLLYQDFGRDLDLWVTSLESQSYQTLNQAIKQLSLATLAFLEGKKSVFRTLHLNSRLHSQILASDKSVDRRQIYQRLANIMLNFSDEIQVEDANQAANMVVFIMVNTLLEKVLYPTLTPAIACEQTAEQFAQSLPKMLVAYLQKP